MLCNFGCRWVPNIYSSVVGNMFMSEGQINDFDYILFRSRSKNIFSTHIAIYINNLH